MYSLIIYDTSNFLDFPIGGQLTSIKNFLKYLSIEQPIFCERVLLVGITLNKDHVGKMQKILINNIEFDFLPVLYRNRDLKSVETSLRLEYLKALFRFKRIIPNSKKTVHYIHTPEAFIQIKLVHPTAKTVVFSHGSFFNMLEGFRFYKNNKIISFMFNAFLIWLIKSTNLIFTLDDLSTNQYLKYTKRVYKVENSIVLPISQCIRSSCHSPLRLLFVGRLSKVKRIDKMIEAVEALKEDVVFTIVGDGEENVYLHNIVSEKQLEGKVKFIGSVSPKEVGDYMQKNDILIMNSVFEGKPMTIIEAMSYGMPIITTPVGGISEMVNNGINSEYTNASAESICMSINKVMKKYKTYSSESIKLSIKYDYKIVNKDIFTKIKELYI